MPAVLSCTTVYCITKKLSKHLQFIIMYKTMRYTLGSKRFYINEFTLKNYQKCVSIRIIPSYSFNLLKKKRNLLYTGCPTS